MTNFIVKKVAVLGAGVMGAQIAAHLVNAGVPAVLFDLPAKEGPKSGIAIKAIEGLKKLSPAPLGRPELAAAITPANYEEHLDLLAGCDLVIEAIAERMAEHGAKVTISSRKAGPCEEVAAEINAKHPGAAIAAPANSMTTAVILPALSSRP